MKAIVKNMIADHIQLTPSNYFDHFILCKAFFSLWLFSVVSCLAYPILIDDVFNNPTSSLCCKPVSDSK